MRGAEEEEREMDVKISQRVVSVMSRFRFEEHTYCTIAFHSRGAVLPNGINCDAVASSSLAFSLACIYSKIQFATVEGTSTARSTYSSSI